MFSPLDPMLHDLLMKFSTVEDLEYRLEQLFRLCDVDHGGSISKDELSNGLNTFQSIYLDGIEHRKADGGAMHPPKLTPDDWNLLTENELLCNSEGYLKFGAFRSLVLTHLRQFVQRKLANAVRLLENPLDVQANLLSQKYLLVSDVLVTNVLMHRSVFSIICTLL